MDTAARFDELFATHGERREVADGEVVLRAGDRAQGLVRVVAGRLALDVPHRDRQVRVAEVGPGTVLGSISLLAGGAPTASATAQGPVTVEVVERSTAQEVVEDDTELRASLEQDATSALHRDVLLRVLADAVPDAPDAELAVASRRLPVRAVAATEVVTATGDEERSALLVLAGRCAVRRGDVEVARVGRGAVLGEGGLLTGEPRTATVTALRDSLVAELDEDALRELVADLPQVGRGILALLARAATATGSGRHHPRDPVGVIAVGAVGEVGNLRVLTTRIADVLGPFGRVQLLPAAAVDRDLGLPGAAASDPGTPTAARVGAYLSEREAAADHLLVEVDAEVDGWTRRALAFADRVLLACPADPDEDVRAAVRALVAATPGTTSVILALHHPAGTDQPIGTAALRDDLGVADVLHVRETVGGDLARAARLTAGRGTALVLGGGGARGFAHLGVAEVLADLGVPVDLYVGASIGAPLAGGMAQGVVGSEMVDVVRRLFRNLLDYTIPVTSLIKGERIATSITQQFDGWDFEDLWHPFACVTTNLTKGRSQVHRTGPIAPMVRASVAIPGVMPPVPAGDDLLVDGGLLDNLPVDVAADDGRCDTIIAVDVSPPLGPRATEDYGLSVSGWDALKATVRRGRSEFPGLTAVLMRSMIVGSAAAREELLAAAHVDLLLELHVRGVGMLDFETVDPVVEQGRELARPMVEAWLAERAAD